VPAGAEILDLGGYSAFVNEHQPQEIQDRPTYHEPEFTPEEGPASVFFAPAPPPTLLDFPLPVLPPMAPPEIRRPRTRAELLKDDEDMVMAFVMRQL
jgi:hypothetical protein